LEKMEQADVVLYLFDVGDLSVNDLHEVEAGLKEKKSNYILVGNKTDVANLNTLDRKFGVRENLFFISAKDGTGIPELKQALVKLVTGGSINTESTIITNARHFAALQEVAKSLHDIKSGLDNGLPGDLLALDIRRCLHYLGEITGEITNEDQLDYIFSKFCIGK